MEECWHYHGYWDWPAADVVADSDDTDPDIESDDPGTDDTNPDPDIEPDDPGTDFDPGTDDTNPDPDIEPDDPGTDFDPGTDDIDPDPDDTDPDPDIDTDPDPDIDPDTDPDDTDIDPDETAPDPDMDPDDTDIETDSKLNTDSETGVASRAHKLVPGWAVASIPNVLQQCTLHHTHPDVGQHFQKKVEESSSVQWDRQPVAPHLSHRCSTLAGPSRYG